MNKSKLALATAIAVPVIAISVYCGNEILNPDKPVITPDTYKLSPAERPLSESDRVWGAAPQSACDALANAHIYTTGYALIDPETNLYGCSTSEIDIPNQKEKKTLQYQVTGFNDKATNIKLVMKITGDQNTAEALVAKKSWAVYSAVLAQTVFSQQLSEEEMQRLANIKAGKEYSRNHNLQLVSNAKYSEVNNVGVYTYEIRGLPVLNGG